MCFSPLASFSSGTVLIAVGTASQVKAEEPGERYLAAVPLLFGTQQLVEGVLWLALQHYPAFEPFEKAATIGFLLVAQVLWPIIVPLTMYKLEKDALRKKMLLFLLLVGIGIGGYVFLCMFKYPLEAKILGKHIKYYIHFPLSNTFISAVGYVIPTVIPPFVSSLKQMRWLGAILTCSFLITTFFYKEFTISIWCFFAALISITILAIIIGFRKNAKIRSAEMSLS